jgi:hypothetical protein
MAAPLHISADCTLVEDQQVGLDQRTKQAREATVTVGEFEVGEQPRHASVDNCVAVSTCLLGECAG